MIWKLLITLMNKLSIITVSYNSEDFIENFIKSVLKFKPVNSELIILDNNSSDKTIDVLKKYDGKLKLVRSLENLGFSKGNNKAVKESTGECLLFLNPDTELLEPIDELIKFYENTTNVGVVAPKLVMEDGKIQESVKNLPRISNAFAEYILRKKHSYSQYVPDTKYPVEVESVYGAAMLISRDIFEKLEGFDEKFFLYYEDVDLCKRIRESGKKIYYYPGVSIKHLVGAAKTEKDRYLLNLEAAQIYHGWIQAQILQLIFKLSRFT